MKWKHNRLRPARLEPAQRPRYSFAKPGRKFRAPILAGCPKILLQQLIRRKRNESRGLNDQKPMKSIASTDGIERVKHNISELIGSLHVRPALVLVHKSLNHRCFVTVRSL